MSKIDMFNNNVPHVHKPLTGFALETEKECAKCFHRPPVKMCCDRPTYPWLNEKPEHVYAVNFKLNFKI